MTKPSQELRSAMPEETKPRIRYKDLPDGTFFRIAARPALGRFFKCQWVSTTEDLEKLICFKPEVEMVED